MEISRSRVVKGVRAVDKRVDAGTSKLRISPS